MKPILLPRSVILLGLVLVALPGCRWGDRRRRPERLEVLRGLSVLEFDGFYVNVKRDSDAADLLLVVGGQAVEQAGLRQGEHFVLTDGGDVYTTYQVLLADYERITLKRRRTFDRRASREGVREVADVVVVTPYNLEEPE